MAADLISPFTGPEAHTGLLTWASRESELTEEPLSSILMSGNLIVLSGNTGRRLRRWVFITRLMGATVSWSTLGSLSLTSDSSPLKDDRACRWSLLARASSNGPELEHLCEVLIGTLSCICTIAGECDDVSDVSLSSE